MIPRLPRGKTIIDVYADFMGYLFESTKALFKSSEPNGELRWDTISESIELVLTHPNGWGGLQQTMLRTAAVKACIVPDTPAGHSSVHFVTEGEAGFSFCATRTQAGRNLKVSFTTVPQDWFIDTFAARRTSLDHRRRRWDHRHKHLQRPQRCTATGRGVV